MYSSDASITGRASVLRFHNRDDVVTLARYASEQKIPLIARGAGTGRGAIDRRGLIVDFSRHMRNVVSIGEDTVRVEPGIVRDQLNKARRCNGPLLHPIRRTPVSTIGGMLSVDAAGSHSVRRFDASSKN
jgi:FAD/FMN-containing dehydrogenase